MPKHPPHQLSSNPRLPPFPTLYWNHAPIYINLPIITIDSHKLSYNTNWTSVPAKDYTCGPRMAGWPSSSSSPSSHHHHHHHHRHHHHRGANMTWYTVHKNLPELSYQLKLNMQYPKHGKTHTYHGSHLPLCFTPKQKKTRSHPPHVLSYDQGEPAVSYRWTGWVWEITGWSSRLQKNYRSF